MKELKIKYAPFIISIIMSVILLAGAITIWVLPSKILGNGDAEEGQITKIVFGSATTLLSLAMIAVGIVSVKREKNRVFTINALCASFGENAYIFEGQLIDEDSSSENAKKTAASVAIGTAFAFLFGFGVFRVYSNGNTSRVFIVHDNGMAVVDPSTLSRIDYPIGYKEKMVMFSKKNGVISIKFPGEVIYYKIMTKNTELGKNGLLNRLKEMFQDENLQETHHAPEADEVFDL